MNMPDKSLSGTSPKQQDLPMSVKSTEKRTALWPTPVSQEGGEGIKPTERGKKLHLEIVRRASRPLTSSPGGSPVRIFQWQESRKGLTGPGRVFGQSSIALLGNYDPATSSLKTSQTSLDLGLTESSLTLPLSGMMRNGKLYQQTTLVRHTSEKESGLLPTPRANDAEKRGNIAIDPRSGLPSAVKMLPTPTVRDWRSGKASPKTMAKNARPLNEVVKMWPTPKTPTGGGQMERKTPGGGIRKLEDAVSAELGRNTGQLNPNFVEFLMNYPKDWTCLT